MLQPSILLRDQRKLVFEEGPPRRLLRDFRESDIIAAGDERGFKVAEDIEERPFDPGFDFAYSDPDGLRVAVEFKLSKPVSRSIQNGLNQIRRYAGMHQGRFDRAELWGLDKSTSTLSIWSDELAPQAQVFGLANVVSTAGPVFGKEGRRQFDSNYVEQRLAQWHQQINTLFVTIGHWAKQSRHDALEGSSIEIDEETITKGIVAKATIVPVGLWVIGANGRVDVLTKKGTAMIVNSSDDPLKPRWLLYSSHHDDGQPLDADRFLALIS
jgi:hypothetical protein